MIETVLKHQLGGISKSIEDRMLKNVAGQTERVVEKIMPKLLSKPTFVNACAKSVTDGVAPAVEEMFKDTFRNVFMPGYTAGCLIFISSL